MVNNKICTNLTFNPSNLYMRNVDCKREKQNKTLFLASAKLMGVLNLPYILFCIPPLYPIAFQQNSLYHATHATAFAKKLSCGEYVSKKTMWFYTRL